MKFTLTLLFSFLSFTLSAATIVQKSHGTKEEITILEKRIKDLEEKQIYETEFFKDKIKELNEKQVYQNGQIDSQTGMIDTAFDGVSAEIGASSYYISILGIVIAILSIGLGVYVTKIEKSIKQMNDDSETLVRKNIQIKESVESLSEKITKDSKGLYAIIRNEESNHILDRLISVPEDIANLFSSITSRDLEVVHFQKLKEAYLQVKDVEKFNIKYLVLFFQHFSGLSLLDDTIKPEFIKSLDLSFNHSYKNDLIKSAKDLFVTVGKLDLSNYKDEINTYIKHLCEHDYCQLEEIYFEINNALETRDLKFKLYDIIEKDPKTIIFRKMYGRMIFDYNYEDLTPSENEIIKDIKSIIEK